MDLKLFAKKHADKAVSFRLASSSPRNKHKSRFAHLDSLVALSVRQKASIKGLTTEHEVPYGLMCRNALGRFKSLSQLTREQATEVLDEGRRLWREEKKRALAPKDNSPISPFQQIDLGKLINVCGISYAAMCERALGRTVRRPQLLYYQAAALIRAGEEMAGIQPPVQAEELDDNF